MDYEAIKRQLITSPVDAWGAILREHFPEPTPAEQGYKDALAARPQLREPQAEASGELWEAGVGKLFRKEVIGVFILGTRKIVAACGLTHADDEKESIANALEIAEHHNARPTQAMDRDYLIRPELSDLGISDPDDPDVCIYDKSDEWVATVKDYATAQAIIGKLADETEASGELDDFREIATEFYNYVYGKVYQWMRLPGGEPDSTLRATIIDWFAYKIMNQYAEGRANQARLEIAGRDRFIAELKAEQAARFTPTAEKEIRDGIEREWLIKGWDNHHNAATCPHCNHGLKETWASLEAKAKRAEAAEKGLREALADLHYDGIAHTFGIRIRDQGRDYVMRLHAEKDGPCKICALLAHEAPEDESTEEGR